MNDYRYILITSAFCSFYDIVYFETSSEFEVLSYPVLGQVQFFRHDSNTNDLNNTFLGILAASG